MAKQKIDMSKTLLLVIGFVLLALSFMTVSDWYETYKSQRAAIIQANSFTGDARTTQARESITSDDTNFDANALLENVNEYASHAVAVENERSELYSKPVIDTTEEDYARGTELKEELLNIFGNNAYQDMWVWFDTNKSSARWTVKTGRSLTRLSNNTIVIPVLFELRDDDNNILGIVFADCDGSAFYNLHKYVTMDGVRMANITYSDEGLEKDTETSNVDTEEFINKVNELAELGPDYNGPINTRTGNIMD